MTNPQAPLIGLISATPVATPPVEQAFAKFFPQARLWNILDDRLLQSADEAGGLTPELEHRMHRLIQHALVEGADGILLTCSMYGGAIQTLAEQPGVPIQAADEAAFDAALAEGFRSVALVSSAAAPLADSVTRFSAHVKAAGAPLETFPVEAPTAFAAARSGDVEALAQALATAVQKAPAAEAVLLGQYSLAAAAERLAELIGRPVIAGPQRAAESFRDALSEAGAA